MLTNPITRIKALYRLFQEDSLFRNTVYLVSSTSIMSALGFLFWVFVAHLYAPAQIGEASALISVTILLSTLSLLGLNAGLLRFLPESKDQNRDINAATIVVAAVTMVASAIYVLVENRVGGNLTLLVSNWHKLAFVLLMASVSLNTLTDAVFISNRKAQYHTVCYTSFAVIKLFLPLLLISLGSLGIFMAYIVAVIISLAASYYLMWRRCGYRFRAAPNWRLITQTKGYAMHNYIGGVLSGLPSQILPLIMIRRLGAADVAYFSMAWTMANLLYVIPSASTQSLLAESSHEPGKQTRHVRRTVIMLLKLLVPLTVFSVLIAPYLLRIFGPQYALHGTRIFQLLALATLPIAGNYIGTTLLNLDKRTGGILTVQIISLVVTFASALLLLPYGLTGVGIAMLLGYITSSLVHAYLYFQHKRRLGRGSMAATWPNVVLTRAARLQSLLWPYGVNKSNLQQLTNGSHNVTLLARSGERYFVVRLYQPGTRSKQQIQQENDYVEYLSQRGRPVPSILVNADGGTVSEMRLGNQTIYYIVMKYAYGQHPIYYSEQLIASMARQQAQLHLDGLAYHGGQVAYHSSPARAAWRSRLIAPVVTQGFSHFDFDASNILISNQDIRCILDFEGFRYGPLTACIFHSLQYLYAHGGTTTDLHNYLLAYQETRQLKRLEGLVLRLALLLKFRDPRLLFWGSRAAARLKLLSSS